MKTPRLPAVFALTLPALSLVLFSPATIHAASIVKSETWLDRLPEAKELNKGAVTLKRPAVNHWVRFEAPAVARRGTLTLSTGTLQSIKSGTFDLATRRATELLLRAPTLAALESGETAMIGFDLASSETTDSGTFTLASGQGFQLMAPSLNPLPLPEFNASDFAGSGNFDSVVTSNRTVAVPVESEGVSANPAATPVPEPSAAALLILTSIGLFARRRQ